ncbi:MAG: hypothetical protein ACRDIF_04745 [Actinomycetota bacterium]
MDILAELDGLVEQIRSAKAVPFSASALINREEVLERLERIRQVTSDELKGGWPMRGRELLVDEAAKEAEALLLSARAESDRLVTDTEVVNIAAYEAGKLVEEAKSRSREIRLETEEYVDAKLANFEVILQKTLAAVTRGRETLRGRFESGAYAEPLSPPEEALPAPDLPRRASRSRAK